MLPNIDWIDCKFSTHNLSSIYLMSSSSIGELFKFTSNLNYILKCLRCYIFLNFIIT